MCCMNSWVCGVEIIFHNNANEHKDCTWISGIIILPIGVGIRLHRDPLNDLRNCPNCNLILPNDFIANDLHVIRQDDLLTLPNESVNRSNDLFISSND